MYSLEPTKAFKKNLKKLSQNEQKSIARKLVLLAQNPFHPSLRTKKVQSLEDVFECSVNMDIRILWAYKNIKIILLLFVGHHDILWLVKTLDYYNNYSLLWQRQKNMWEAYLCLAQKAKKPYIINPSSSNMLWYTESVNNFFSPSWYSVLNDIPK